MGTLWGWREQRPWPTPWNTTEASSHWSKPSWNFASWHFKLHSTREREVNLMAVFIAFALLYNRSFTQYLLWINCNLYDAAASSRPPYWGVTWCLTYLLKFILWLSSSVHSLAANNRNYINSFFWKQIFINILTAAKKIWMVENRITCDFFKHFSVTHQPAGELSGYGWSHIHCNSLKRKPPTNLHQVGALYCLFILVCLRPDLSHWNLVFSLQGNGIGESGAKVISDAIRASASGCVVDI